MVARELPNNPLAAACETEADPDFETDHNFLEKQMKIKTSELTGAALDWAVAEIENPQPTYYRDDIGLQWEKEYTPSTDWSQGGPIIEREGVSLIRQTPDRWVSEYSNGCDRFDHARSHGPTPLIAAMRCYVASKLGDTVDVPDELC